MANSAKAKGDAGEREAVRVLLALAPDLLDVGKPMRALGAGRKEDVGDIHFFNDCAVQIKTMKDIGAAVRQAAAGALAQSRNAAVPFHLGMAPVPRAPAASVRWIASCLDWPDDAIQHDEVFRTGTPSVAIAHLRNERLGVPRVRRIAAIERKGADTIIVAPIEAWLEVYRAARAAHRRLLVPA